MNRTHISIAFWFLLLVVPSHAAPLPAPVSKALREADIPTGSVAIFVQETGASRPLLAHQANAAMSPASTMKLVTTYAALELLGPAHTWKTTVLADTPVTNGVLAGNLYLQGSGDPALTLERLWLLLRDLRQAGLRDIRGDLVLDGERFRQPPADPGAFDGAPHRPYNTLPDAVLLNFKSVRFRLLPESGEIRVLADPAPPQLRIVNRLRTLGGECGDWREGITTSVNGSNDVPTVSFDGVLPGACGEQSLHLSLLDATGYAHALFRQLWEESGGTLKGAARRGETPSGAKALAASESRPLAEAVRDINKFSNNVMARQLLLTLGEGDADAGGRAILSWLNEKNLSFPELVIENGSGLSRNERISARHLGQLLLAAYRSPVMPEFLSSLPIAAVDGTMKKRLTDRPAAGHAHLKTGSLKGVKAIAGYVHSRSGRTYTLVCLVNHPNAAEAQTAQDALVEWIYSR